MRTLRFRRSATLVVEESSLHHCLCSCFWFYLLHDEKFMETTIHMWPMIYPMPSCCNCMSYCCFLKNGFWQTRSFLSLLLSSSTMRASHLSCVVIDLAASTRCAASRIITQPYNCASTNIGSSTSCHINWMNIVQYCNELGTNMLWSCQGLHDYISW